jgi:NADH:ubiquinone oxidoreductase subunit 3 (subunit A)
MFAGMIYGAILFFAIVAIVIGCCSLSVGYFIGRKQPNNLVPVVSTNVVVQTNWVERPK